MGNRKLPCLKKYKEMKKIAFSIVLLMFISCNVNPSNQDDNSGNGDDQPDALQYAIRMADSEIQRNPDPRLIGFRTKPKWEYDIGLVCSSMLKTWERSNDNKYLDYVKLYFDTMIDGNGTIDTYKMSDYNIDRINPGKSLFTVYNLTKETKYHTALETLRDQMRDHPRTSEGGFWHKKRYPWQMWLDGLYMGSPFLAQYAVEKNEPALFDDVANQIYLIDLHTYDIEKQLYYHGWDESKEQRWADPSTGCSPHFWGRAMGWFSMALVDVLDFIPPSHPEREAIISVLKKLAWGVKRYQDSESGVWWQVLDMGGSEGNYLEASCSSMFTYCLLKAVKKGYLPEEYRDVAVRAYSGIIENFITENPDGTISLTNVCSVAGLGGNPYRDGSYEYYIGEPQRDNDPKGVGPFIMASLLMDELKTE
jgi:unsaturated rhamnogalacturonyl hydrolase